MYENATPELVRDFFWDDEFRLKWDDMLSHAETLEDCPTTGTMVVQWVRKVRGCIYSLLPSCRGGILATYITPFFFSCAVSFLL